MKPQIAVIIFLGLCSVVKASITFTFSEIAGTGGTRISVSGNGTLDGLVTTETYSGSITNSVHQVGVGSTDFLSATDVVFNGSYSAFQTILTPTVNTFSSSDLASGDVFASFAAESLVSHTISLLGVSIFQLAPGVGAPSRITVYTDGTAFGAVNFKTNFSVDTADSFSNFNELGTASWTTGGTMGNDTITLAVVPEPTTTLLLGFGVLSLACSRRRT